MSRSLLEFQRINLSDPGEIPKNLDALVNGLVGRFHRRKRMQQEIADLSNQVVGQRKSLAESTDKDLKRTLREYHEAARRGSLDEDSTHLVNALAGVCEAAKRVLGLDPYPVQVQAALAMRRGFLVEMATGEGKTLAASLTAVLAGWTGKSCHVITANDYLAARDAQWLAPLYEYCGLSAGSVTSSATPLERRKAYRNSVCYTTSKEIVADFLRDRLSIGTRHQPERRHLMAFRSGLQRTRARQVLNGLHTAIVDEADSVLIDEAVTPLIISRKAEDSILQDACRAAYHVAESLEKETHYTVNRRYKEIEFTETGEDAVAARKHDFPEMWRGENRLLEMVQLALSAREFYHKGEQYLVKEGKVVIIDEFTGRAMPNRTWRDGLHQAVEMREGLPLTQSSETLARLSFQRFFRFFHHISGMSGTAREAAEEFWQIYQLPVIPIPLHRPSQRVGWPTRVFTSIDAKNRAIADEIEKLRQEERPVLVGLRSVEACTRLSRILHERDLDHDILNAEHPFEEAEVIARAGRPGKITLATNMAGRGTDIRLGQGVAKKGGLHVIATELHEAARIDRQLIGRCARQGDPGSFRFFLSLEDELILNHQEGRGVFMSKNAKDGEELGEGQRIVPMFRRAQKRAEQLAFKQRKSVLRSDHWLDEALGFTGPSLGF